jgi:hypothetical protein
MNPNFWHKTYLFLACWQIVTLLMTTNLPLFSADQFLDSIIAIDLTNSTIPMELLDSFPELNTSLAQAVERQTENLRVSGSTPLTGTNHP